jgi:hypothetical protein
VESPTVAATWVLMLPTAYVPITAPTANPRTTIVLAFARTFPVIDGFPSCALSFTPGDQAPGKPCQNFEIQRTAKLFVPNGWTFAMRLRHGESALAPSFVASLAT